MIILKKKKTPVLSFLAHFYLWIMAQNSPLVRKKKKNMEPWDTVFWNLISLCLSLCFRKTWIQIYSSLEPHLIYGAQYCVSYHLLQQQALYIITSEIQFLSTKKCLQGSTCWPFLLFIQFVPSYILTSTTCIFFLSQIWISFSVCQQKQWCLSHSSLIMALIVSYNLNSNQIVFSKRKQALIFYNAAIDTCRLPHPVDLWSPVMPVTSCI